MNAFERERILPALVVPVVDVQRERDDLDVGDRLLAQQPRQERISRRAAGTAFRGEELDENRRFWRRLAARVPASRATSSGTNEMHILVVE